MTSSRAARLAIIGLGLSVLLHLIAAVMVGFSQTLIPMFLAVLIYPALMIGLADHRRWVAWIGFLLLPIGMIGAIWTASGMFGAVATMFWGIAAADAVAIGGLFGVLWRSQTQDQTHA